MFLLIWTVLGFIFLYSTIGDGETMKDWKLVLLCLICGPGAWVVGIISYISFGIHWTVAKGLVPTPTEVLMKTGKAV